MPTFFDVPNIIALNDQHLHAQLQQLIDQKTKPPGSLGRLESLALQLGMIQNTAQPSLTVPAIVVFAADHGVMEENVSAFPQSVTWQMVENFLAGGAAINVFARQNQAQLQIVDAGVKHEFGARDGLLDRKIAWGSQNFVRQAAMSEAQCVQALQAGMQIARDVRGNLLGLGEMGIGNTTVAAALMQKLTGLPLAQCVGAGTGLSPAGIDHKQAVIARALQTHAAASTGLEILACLGGFEIAMMVGAILAAAQARKVILIDGFIVTSALLVAHKIAPQVLDYCVFAHCSDESGHARMLSHLGVRPLLALDLRLGEGSGAALALPLLHAACNFLSQMASFSSAQVSGALATSD